MQNRRHSRKGLLALGLVLVLGGSLCAQGRGGGGGRHGVGGTGGGGSGNWGRNGPVINDADGDGIDDRFAERLRLHRAKTSSLEQRGNMLRALGFPTDAEIRIVSNPGDIPGLKSEEKKRLKTDGVPAAPRLFAVDADRTMVVCYGWTREKGLLVCWYILYEKDVPRKVEGKILGEKLGEYTALLAGPLPEKIRWENPPVR
ncbi:MAG: hypothetical protein KA419_16435 [Acidobacteria bacterium]|nr:hypothetical protein [Acidobacteriota bacterium]